MAKGFKIPSSATCRKVKGKKMAVCGWAEKPKKKGRGKKPRAGGKYHKTTRGLAQDQRLKSQEPHEKIYRKRKRAGKI